MSPLRCCLLSFCMTLMTASSSFAQGDVFAEHKINGLKRLGSVALTIRPNMVEQVMTVKEFGDALQVALGRDIPSLDTAASTDAAPAWIELGIVTAPQGGIVELSVYRWVVVEGTNERIFTRVWTDARLVLRGINQTVLREAIGSLVTALAADVVRARQ